MTWPVSLIIEPDYQREDQLWTLSISVDEVRYEIASVHADNEIEAAYELAEILKRVMG